VTCLRAARYLDWRAVSDFAALAARVEPVAIIAANPYALMYATLAARKAGVPARLVCTYHSTRLPGIKEPLMTVGYLPLFWAADCTIFVSAMQSRYCMRRGIFSRRNEVIFNGIDTSHFAQADEAAGAEVRRRLGFGADDYVIGLSAVLRPEKNPVQLVEAVARLRAQGVPARALMIGDGDLRPAVERRARELGVSGDIAITGLIRDVRAHVSACDATVLCSTAIETFSLAALEAMAMGKPVVLSEVGGAAEMVFPGWNGYLFPAGDTAAFVQRLALLADRETARRLGRNARRAVESLFSEGAMVDRYEQTLLELSGRCPGPKGLWPSGQRVNTRGT
jgi:glycosyltransferase involved in cell wall biosynthesis